MKKVVGEERRGPGIWDLGEDDGETKEKGVGDQEADAEKKQHGPSPWSTVPLSSLCVLRGVFVTFVVQEKTWPQPSRRPVELRDWKALTMKDVRIKGVLLDLGETLLHFGRVNIPQLFEAGSQVAYGYLTSLGLAMPEFVKYHRRKLRAIRWSYFKSRITGREFNALDVLDRVNTRIGVRLTPEQTIELAACWYEPLGRCATVEEGTIGLLKELRDAGITLGIVSNTFIPAQVLDRQLQREGLLELLPLRVYSCQIGIRKPDSRIFQEALSRSGLAAEQTLFVGDSPKADVWGAARMGMITVLKDPAGVHARSRFKPDHTIARLAELREVVRQYNA